MASFTPQPLYVREKELTVGTEKEFAGLQSRYLVFAGAKLPLVGNQTPDIPAPK